MSYLLPSLDPVPDRVGSNADKVVQQMGREVAKLALPTHSCVTPSLCWISAGKTLMLPPLLLLPTGYQQNDQYSLTQCHGKAMVGCRRPGGVLSYQADQPAKGVPRSSVLNNGTTV